MPARTLFALGFALLPLSQAAPAAVSTTWMLMPMSRAAMYSFAAIETPAPSISGAALNASLHSITHSNVTALREGYDELWSLLVATSSSSTPTSKPSECKTVMKYDTLNTDWPQAPEYCFSPQPGGDCNMWCVQEQLERVAKSACAIGIEDAITAYDALEWINTNYTSFNLSSIPSRTSNLSFKEDMLNVIMNIANNVLSNYMIETDYCDDGCLARSLEVVAYRSSLAAIRWCHYLFTKAGLSPVNAEQLGTMMRAYLVLSDRDHLWLPIEDGGDQKAQNAASETYCMTSKVFEWKTIMSTHPPSDTPFPTFAVTFVRRPELVVDGTVVGTLSPTHTPTPAELLEAVIPDEYRPSGLLKDLMTADPCEPVANTALLARSEYVSANGGPPYWNWNRDKFMAYTKVHHPRLHRLLWDLYKTPATPWADRYTRFTMQVGDVITVVDEFFPMEMAQEELFPDSFRRGSLTNSSRHYNETLITPRGIEGRSLPPVEGVYNPDPDAGPSRPYRNLANELQYEGESTGSEISYLWLDDDPDAGPSSPNQNLANEMQSDGKSTGNRYPDLAWEDEPWKYDPRRPGSEYSTFSDGESATISDEEFKALRDQRATNTWEMGQYDMEYRDTYHHIQYEEYEDSARGRVAYDPPTVDEITKWQNRVGQVVPETSREKWLALRGEEYRLNAKMGAGLKTSEEWKAARKNILRVEKEMKNFNRVLFDNYGAVDPGAAYANTVVEDNFRRPGMSAAQWESERWYYTDMWHQSYAEFKDLLKDVERTRKRIATRPWTKLFDDIYTDEAGLTRLGLTVYDPALTGKNILRPGEYVDSFNNIYNVGEGPEWAKGGKRWKAAKTAAKWASVMQEEEGGLLPRILRWFLRIFRI